MAQRQIAVGAYANFWGRDHFGAPTSTTARITELIFSQEFGHLQRVKGVVVPNPCNNYKRDKLGSEIDAHPFDVVVFA